MYQYNIEEGKIRKNSSNRKIRPFGSVGKTGTLWSQAAPKGKEGLSNTEHQPLLGVT